MNNVPECPTKAFATPPEVSRARTLPDIFNARVALTPDLVAYRQYDVRSQSWIDWTWQAVASEVARWRGALAGEQFLAGSRIATVMGNGVAYVCADQAALSLGLAIVPLHPTDNPGNVGFILRDSDISALVIDKPEYWAELAPEVAALSALKRIVIVAGAAESVDPFVTTDSRAVHADRWLNAAPSLEASGAAISPEMMAAIVYTSGTTGRPKGVMLSHRNVVSNVLSVLKRVGPSTEDVFLSFLPLSHTFERTAGYYLPMAAGSTVAYARSIALLSEDMRTIRPTILISVPRIYERAYTQNSQRAGQGEPARAQAVRLDRAHGLEPVHGVSGIRPRCDRLSICGLCPFSTNWSPRRSGRSLEVDCATQSLAVRQCLPPCRTAYWRWVSTFCRATA